MTQKTEYEIAMAEFLARGGEIQQIARGVQSTTATTNFWGAPKKKAKVALEVELTVDDDEDEATLVVDDLAVDDVDDIIDELGK